MPAAAASGALVALLCCCLAAATAAGATTLTLLHVNDMHHRVEPNNDYTHAICARAADDAGHCSGALRCVPPALRKAACWVLALGSLRARAPPLLAAPASLLSAPPCPSPRRSQAAWPA
jgi:hypothetical protein